MVDTKEEFLNMLKDYPEFADEIDLFLEIKGEDLYNQIVKHINTHKWLLQEKVSIKVSLRQAIYSWYEEVYEPLKMAIEQYDVDKYIKKTKLQTFFELSDHVHYLTLEKMEKLKDPAGRNSITGCPDNERLSSCVYININYSVFSFLSKFATSKFSRWWFGLKAKLFLT